MAPKTSNDKWVWILIGIVVLMGIEIVYLSYQNQKLESIINDPKTYFKTLTNNDNVPSISALDVEGNEVDISYSSNEPFTLFFWFSTTCTVCEENFAFWNSIQNDYKHEKVRYYGMCVGNPEAAYDFVEQNDLQFSVISVNDAFILESYKGNVLPQTVLISPEGTVLGTWPGILEKEQEEKILSFLSQFQT